MKKQIGYGLMIVAVVMVVVAIWIKDWGLSGRLIATAAVVYMPSIWFLVP